MEIKRPWKVNPIVNGSSWRSQLRSGLVDPGNLLHGPQPVGLCFPANLQRAGRQSAEQHRALQIILSGEGNSFVSQLSSLLFAHSTHRRKIRCWCSLGIYLLKDLLQGFWGELHPLGGKPRCPGISGDRGHKTTPTAQNVDAQTGRIVLYAGRKFQMLCNPCKARMESSCWDHFLVFFRQV